MVFQKFLNNGKVSLCGAQVVIAVKRYPDESEVSDIISQLRANHVMVHIAVDSIPSGGTNSATLYEMAFQTNGYSYFATALDSSFVSMNYTVASTDGSYSYKFPRNDSKPLYATGQSDVLYLKGSLSYKWTIDYDYNTAATQIIKCRMYSSDYHDFLPLPDF
ncbi:hypothetical protein GCK72_015346 [Caenorhabditis remanei]|uniref:DUF7154 domain-containing protein n=1 Tax=Caenorhabditis remanei TaxID=31234 RepID=A0A6A5GW99_CAERE|nr:hypothetical protein GCK72_015346 [Caenorhabditis remanei]KAF1758886.1 hypothetical protein GCK72_015346 [Caenorhabditis remanei]